MAQYKVPQNVESEDKLIGPLSMKQFIYAIIAIGWGILWWRVFLGAGPIGYVFMAFVIIPISGFLLLLAFGRREEQSFENYLIALIRFTVMPRQRTWMKDDGAREVIVNTPPPPAPTTPTQEDMRQVQSRLQQLALVVDTRGHVKNESVQMPDPANQAAEFSQRVFTPASLQHELIPSQLEAHDDLLTNAETGEHAEAVGQMLQNVEHSIRDSARASMQTITNTPTPPRPALSPGNTPAQTQAPATSQTAPSNAILKTVMDTPELSVAQVSRVANRGQLTPGQSVQI